MAGDQDLYQAFMLRLWRMSGSACSWYASLEDPHTHERHVFPDLDSLFVFLVAHVGVMERGRLVDQDRQGEQ